MKTVEETRHANLLAILADLAKEHGERGAIQKLAEKVPCSHSQLSQLKTKAKHSKTGKPRNIGPSMARKIETAAKKDRGWLDVPHDSEDLEAKVTRLVGAALDAKLGVASEKPQAANAA